MIPDLEPHEKIRPWSDLPCELLGQIGDELPLVELLGFRSTCKDWRHASSTASAACESSVDQEPWFLLYNTADSDSTSNCRLYQPSTGKVYTMKIDEFNGSTCIASKQGWLLLVRETSLFFFCPFSRVKIDLPDLPNANLLNPVAVFSTTPTSADCMVCIMHDLNTTSKEVYMLKHGDNEWGKHNQVLLRRVTAATFKDGVFYFFQGTSRVLVFHVQNEIWIDHVLVPSQQDEKISTTVTFISSGIHFESDLKRKFGLDKGDSLSICGTVLPSNKCCTFVHNKDIKAEEDEERCHKGVWIHPRFFQVPEIHSWNL